MTVKAAEGSTITADALPPILPKSGYVLTGWMADDGTVYSLEELAVTATEGLTLTAQYGYICDGGAECPSSRFQDVTGLSSEAHAAVDYMVENGYMNGMSATMFAPHQDLNRAMMVTILYRLAGSPAVEGVNTFTDVSGARYYYNAVIWASENGITKGISANLFAPDKSLTRQELVTFLYRYAAFAGHDVTASADLSAYTDASSIGRFAADAFEWAIAEGIIKGTSDTTLEPLAATIRAQVSLMVYRLLSEQD